MPDVLAFAVVLVIFGGTLGGSVWLARRVRRRGLGGGYSLMGPLDEVWNPGALQARIEIQVHDERPDPAPAPGDRLM